MSFQQQVATLADSISDSADMFQIGGGVTIDGREVPAGNRVSYGASNKNTVYRGVRQDLDIKQRDTLGCALGSVDTKTEVPF